MNSKKKNWFINQGGSPYLLDNYSNTLIAISLRKLKSDAIYGIRVRRLSDSAETDVELYDDITKSIDINSVCSAGGTLADFVEIGDQGRVSIGYDQSGNGNDLIGVTQPSQPNFIDSAQNIPKFEGKASILFNADYLQILGGLSELGNGNDFSIFSIISIASANDLGTIFSTSFTPTYGLGQWVDNRPLKRNIFLNADVFIFSNMSVQNTVTNRLRLNSAIIDGSLKLVSSFDNGNIGDQNVSWSGNYINNILSIGSNSIAANILIGHISEFIIFSEKKDTDRIDIETEINNYYSIY